MEKRAVLAIVLSVAILLIWQAFFAPTPPPPSQPEPSRATAPTPTPGAPPEVATPPAIPKEEARAGTLVPAGPAPAGPRAAEVITPLYHAAFGADGAALDWTLDYRGSKALAVGNTFGPLTVGLRRGAGLAEFVKLSPTSSQVVLTRGQPSGVLSFSGVTANGLRVQKVLGFQADSYQIEVRLRIEGLAAEPVVPTIYWTGPPAIFGSTRLGEPAGLPVTFGETRERLQVLGRILVGHDGKPESFDAPAAALKDPKETGNVQQLKDPALLPTAVAPSPARWVALENDYFIAALIPAAGGGVIRGRERDRVVVGLVFPEVRPDPARPWEGRASLYVGPKEWERLSALNAGLEQAQARNYGAFPFPGGIPMEWFCVPLLWLMNFFATKLPGENYGVAIILLTVLVKIAFYPLTQKSMNSMKRMQALQPQINALRARYKADPQRFQREQMELFRKYRVNPMGGCLPMVVQIPIFYALYLTLQYSVELQGASFVLWITDLSKKDPYYVLPILMGGSMLVQQMMTPTVGDPRQARVMLIMPVVFTFMFLEFPTGLVLYWLVNNLLSIGQQYLIDRAARRAKLGEAVEVRTEKESRRA